MEQTWNVIAVKYAERNSRTRADSFLFDDDHASPHEMDYFVWVLKSGEQTIVVDTGYDMAEAERRGRPILRNPATAVQAAGVDAETVDTVIITHLHYDHAGTLGAFPNARFHLQEAEMAFATGPCMCAGVMRAPFTARHVCLMVERVFSGRVIFHDGDGHVAPGVTVHRAGGHSRGLQVVRVKTQSGYLCLASDASHYYENFVKQKVFPIVVDLEDMIRGFALIQTLATRPSLVIPGHDPLVTQHFAPHGTSGFAWRLDTGPIKPIEGVE
ncbi:MAG: N-acyl homoserine lactonase family protein [Hyphomicrobiales bacterium]|nr:N-acyl homoserine lactonase family protein [Hyphomicrobiales bacterium]